MQSLSESLYISFNHISVGFLLVVVQFTPNHKVFMFINI